MPVGDDQEAFRREAARRGLDLTPQVKVEWLSGKGHLEAAAQGAPKQALERLAALHSALGGDPQALAAKRRMSAAADFALAGGRVLVEFDEFQHFSSARLRSLDVYDGSGATLDVARYRGLCLRNLAKADSYRTAKETPDFHFPGGRTAQRAYLDTVRDLLAPAFGHVLLRVPFIGISVPAAVDDLERQLAAAEAAHYGDPEAIRLLEHALASAREGRVAPLRLRTEGTEGPDAG